MRLIILLLFLLLPGFCYAGCDDQPSNEVDWTNCNFVENLELIGVGMANAKMSGVNLSLANLENSQLNNSDLSIGNFIFAKEYAAAYVNNWLPNPFPNLTITFLISLFY